MMESSAEQVVPKSSSADLESRFSPAPLELETRFCMDMKKEFEGGSCHVSFHIIPGIMKFFVKFNYRPFEPIHDLLGTLIENMGLLQNEGKVLFYVLEKILQTPIEDYEKEWECVSFNLNYLDILKHIR